MAKATVKSAEVEARQYVGAGTFTIMNDLKGELHAKKGDWLIGSEKGKIDVLTDTEFKAQYDLDGELTDTDKINGAAPAAGIIEPSASATRASAPVPGIVDQSQKPLSGEAPTTKPVTVDPPQTVGHTTDITVKADSSLKLEGGATIPASEVFPGTVLSGGWTVEHITSEGSEIQLSLKAK